MLRAADPEKDRTMAHGAPFRSVSQAQGLRGGSRGARVRPAADRAQVSPRVGGSAAPVAGHPSSQHELGLLGNVQDVALDGLPGGVRPDALAECHEARAECHEAGAPPACWLLPADVLEGGRLSWCMSGGLESNAAGDDGRVGGIGDGPGGPDSSKLTVKIDVNSRRQDPSGWIQGVERPGRAPGALSDHPPLKLPASPQNRDGEHADVGSGCEPPQPAATAVGASGQSFRNDQLNHRLG